MDHYTAACTCRDECLHDRCRFCGAFDDPCPHTGADLPPGRWVGQHTKRAAQLREGNVMRLHTNCPSHRTGNYVVGIYPYQMRLARRTYRALRRGGMYPWDARLLVVDLLMAPARFATPDDIEAIDKVESWL